MALIAERALWVNTAPDNFQLYRLVFFICTRTAICKLNTVTDYTAISRTVEGIKKLNSLLSEEVGSSNRV